MRRLAFLVLGVLFLVRPAAAQDTSRGEFSAGWRFTHANLGNVPFTFEIPKPNDFPRGWYGDVALNLSPKFALVGEAGGTYLHDTTSRTTGSVTIAQAVDVTFHTFMGGVRVRAPQNARLVPFGQVLIGGEHNSSSSERTLTFPAGRPSTSLQEASGSGAVLALDGGLTVAAGPIGLRAAAGYARFFGTADADAFRLSIGVTRRF